MGDVEGYEEEQTAAKDRIAALQIQITEKRSQVANAERFLAVVRRYTQVETLDRAILNELIDRIDVHTGEGNRSKRKQTIEIHWRFIDAVEPVLCQKGSQEEAC